MYVILTFGGYFNSVQFNSIILYSSLMGNSICAVSNIIKDMLLLQIDNKIE